MISRQKFKKRKFTKEQIQNFINKSNTYKELGTYLGYDDHWLTNSRRWLKKYNLNFEEQKYTVNIYETHVEFKIRKKAKYNKNQTIYVDLEDWDKVKNLTWLIRKGNSSHVNYFQVECGKLNHIRLHQYVFGKKEGYVIDHINHNTFDNRKSNLRHLPNIINSILHQKGNNKYRGVKQTQSGKWQAHLMIKGKLFTSKSIKIEEEAAIEWNKLLRRKLTELNLLEYYDLCKNIIVQDS